jgi:hypothetical protein
VLLPFQRKFEGTRVQVETFLAWKAKFDAEMAEIKAKKNAKMKDNVQKLTGEFLDVYICTCVLITCISYIVGKELFMRDHTLDDSDVKFLERGMLMPILYLIVEGDCNWLHVSLQRVMQCKLMSRYSLTWKTWT